MDAEIFAVLDGWCKRRCDKIMHQTESHILSGGSLDDPEHLRLVGESRAYHAMRSYLHGAIRVAGRP